MHNVVSATQQSSQAKLNGSPKIIGNTRSQIETVKQIAMNGIRASISASVEGGLAGIGPVVYRNRVAYRPKSNEREKIQPSRDHHYRFSCPACNCVHRLQSACRQSQRQSYNSHSAFHWNWDLTK